MPSRGEMFRVALTTLQESAYALESENAQLVKNVRDLATRLDDALDEVYALKQQNKGLEQLNEELRTLNASAPESKRAKAVSR
jgi:hypothetical protein